jgi:hypothetical protein
MWHNATARAGTLPERHRGRSADEVSRAEGWALHKIVPEFDKPDKQEDVLQRGIGDDGVAVSSATGLASSSPMHFIQKTFLDTTSFYLH